ncbi:unnamed protein product [Symbiodinium natans]|uniref:Uncharacterized protein n=1 Tax=Symbiodinium natans TaxID=878477 RepID=A0A812RU49_9DINO|nr:unnamed protein product [Symbiodinium natans]
MQAATGATTAFGSGSMPLAAQQVSPGLWCVLVADSSYTGAGVATPASGSLAGNVPTGNMSCQGVLPHLQTEHFSSRGTHNLSLAEHLMPIPETVTVGCESSQASPQTSVWASDFGLQASEMDAPCTPPPRRRNVEMAPTPSPIGFRSSMPSFPQPSEVDYKDISDVPGFPSHRIGERSGQNRARLKLECLGPDQKQRSDSSESKAHLQLNRAVDCHGASCTAQSGQKHAAVASCKHPRHGHGRGPNHHPRKRYTHRSADTGFPLPRAMHNALHRDEPLDSILEHAIWDLMEQVLMQRPKLEEGKRVNVTLSDWLSLLPADEGNTCQRRALANRALRTMTKRLPGCCWTVDFERQEMQVHLANVARFSSFCDGMC